MSTLGYCTIDGCNGPLCVSGEDVQCESCGCPYPEHPQRLAALERRKVEQAQAAKEKAAWERKVEADRAELQRRLAAYQKQKETARQKAVSGGGEQALAPTGAK